MGRLSDTILAELEKPEAAASDPAPTESEKPGEAPPEKSESIEEKPDAPQAEGEIKESGGAEDSASDDNSKVAGETPPAKPEDKKAEEKPAAPKLFKVKVDGQEKEVQEDVLIAGFQLKETSYKRLQEAQQMKKDALAHREMITRAPLAAIEDALIAAASGNEEIAKRFLFDEVMKWLEPYAARATMTPEERQLAEERERFSREKKQLDGEKARLRGEREAKLREQEMGRIDVEVKAAQEKFGLKGDKLYNKLLRMMADDMELDLQTSAEQVAVELKRQIDEEKAATRAELNPTPSLDEWKKQNAEYLKKIEEEKAQKARQATSIPPFPASTATNGEAQPKEERAPRAKREVYRSQREFHEALLREAAH